MKLFRNLCVVLAASFAFSSIAKADPVTEYIDYTLTSADSHQLGRASRNSIPQTFAADEPYPGQVNLTSTYYYQTFVFNASEFIGAQYIAISTFDPMNGNSYFVSAYQDSYDPTYNSATDDHRKNNWLGDAGFSGNYQVNDGGSFQFVLPTGHDLVVLLNSTLAGGALPTYDFNITVQGFGDANLGDPITPTAVTPEPSSILLVATGLVGAVGAVRRRFV